MGFVELLLLAVALSMDAFAVAVCLGLAMPKATLGNAAVVGLYFGAFQAGMPLAGYWAAALFAERVMAFGHWIAFALLVFLGGRMAVGSGAFGKGGDKAAGSKSSASRPMDGAIGPSTMLPLAIATSIDALAVGVSFVLLRVEVFSAVSIIGATTLAISMAGVKLGGLFGDRFKSKAELVGGLVLILIGLRILVG